MTLNTCQGLPGFTLGLANPLNSSGAAYTTLLRRVAAVMVLPPDLELSLDAPTSNVA